MPKRGRSSRTKTKTKGLSMLGGGMQVESASGMSRLVKEYLDHEKQVHQYHQESVKLASDALMYAQNISDRKIRALEQQLQSNTEAVISSLESMRAQLRELLTGSELTVEGGGRGGDREQAVFQLETHQLEWCPDKEYDCYTIPSRSEEAKRIIAISKKRESALGPRSVDYRRYIDEVRKPLEKLTAKGVRFDKFRYESALAHFAYLDKFWRDEANDKGEMCQSSGNCTNNPKK